MYYWMESESWPKKLRHDSIGRFSDLRKEGEESPFDQGRLSRHGDLRIARTILY